MSQDHDPQDRSYLVISDGADALGEISFFPTLAEALEFASDMEAKNNAVTVEICL